VQHVVPVEEAEVADGAPVAGAEEGLAVIAPSVAVADQVAAHEDRAGFIRGQFPPGLVPDAQGHSGKRAPDGRDIRSGCVPRAQRGRGDETQLGRPVVLVDGRVRGEPSCGGQGDRIQPGPGADDAGQPPAVHPAGQAAFGEQAQHGGHQHEPGDLPVGDAGEGGGQVEFRQGDERGAGVQGLGQGIQGETGRQRSRRERAVVPGQPEVVGAGFEGAPPGFAGAGERLGQGGGSGGESVEEDRAGAPVGQGRDGTGPGPRLPPSALGGQPFCDGLPLGDRPARVEHGDGAVAGDPGGEGDGEVDAVGQADGGDERPVGLLGQRAGRPGRESGEAEPVGADLDGRRARLVPGPVVQLIQEGHP